MKPIILGEVFLLAIRQPTATTSQARIDAVLDVRDALWRLEDLVVAGGLSLSALLSLLAQLEAAEKSLRP